ncbi:symmetrical bis(5'-nucleosyl)-tetraphosphatase [Neisseria lisongii]|uniref:Bis(5'-nucleosyl)-tetraphosphatase, symmetrical n=1 Tax=Neisseria lisongii TaxID=2912188 RepID=A0AAW5AKS7_9NEIS|nr:symmetrical bis(5'-nucleosyl)-tetraphosphatase [Neisseria lisongii]MCF7528707.1 symmetrical bis(5'-nucleosyl)-tetraphosphatase [Neisseria lisongii]MCF7529565.1 symmetrical bis(5'-nucleosyl)-tetraphosphatase [Neisseria lisongii]
MAHYAIGDIQGCYDELTALLHKIGFNHGNDTLWLTGDIVNRGPKSLEALQFAMKHESSVRIVLGNHDLHLLAVGYGHGSLKRSDTLSPILKHPQSKTMLDWLRRQSLLIQTDRYVMVHAGILPQWSVEQAQSLAEEVEHELQGKRVETFFSKMYGNTPTAWKEDLGGYKRLRFITNVFTRMRALTFTNELEFDFKAGLDKMPLYLRAWFQVPDRRHLSHTVVFGHWSALGHLNTNNIISLDTGALWGGKLTAIDLDTQHIIQVDAINGLNWKTVLK